MSWSHRRGRVYREAGMVDPNAIVTIPSSGPAHTWDRLFHGD